MTSHRTRVLASNLLLAALLAIALVSCGDRARCEQLREETYVKKQAWAQCSTSEECIPIGGNPGDCTGVLTCNFAVHRIHREEAERLMFSMTAASADCHACVSPNCSRTELPYCEPLTHTCVMLDVYDAGPKDPPAPEPDGGP